MLSPHLVLTFLFLRVRACENTQVIALSYTSKRLSSMHFFLGTQTGADQLQKASALCREKGKASLAGIERALDLHEHALEELAAAFVILEDEAVVDLLCAVLDY